MDVDLLRYLENIVEKVNNNDTPNYSLLLVWKKSVTGISTEMHSVMEEVSSRI